jgi:HK97 gp10 family phage protein
MASGRAEGRELAKKFREKSDKATNAVERAIQKGALQVERDAKINAPVDTGRLRASISHRLNNSGTDNPSASIGTNVEYAKYVEYGTAQRGEVSAAFLDIPENITYKTDKKGMPAQPFLMPSFLKNKRAIMYDIKKAMQQVLKG